MNLTTLVFLGLAVLWAIVLLPELLRKLSGVRSSDSIRSFNQQLSVLDRSGARPSGSNVIDLRAPRSRASAPAERRGRPAPDRARTGRPRTAAPRSAPSPAMRKRRQEVITVLASAAALTLLCAVAFGLTAFVLLHVVADILLVAYLVLLSQANQAVRAPAPGTARDDRHVVRTSPMASVPQARRVAN